jgi:SAM-dependent methyltransferase
VRDVVPTASQLAHEGLLVHNPLPLAAIDAGIDQLDLLPGARVLDVGSGTGELLRRIVERWPGVTGVGIDLVEAPPVHTAVELRTGDATSIETERFDVVCCIGAIHALGGFPSGYRRLAALAPVVLLGDGYWRREPDPTYLRALDATADELPMRDGLDSAFDAAGLRTKWSVEAEVADLTAYEEALLANADRYPERADVAEYAAAIRRWRAAPGGTDTLGFALFLLERS